MAILDETIKFVNNQQQRVKDILVRHPDDKNAKHTLKPIVFHYDKALAEIREAQDVISDLQEKYSALSKDNSSLKVQVDELSKRLGLKERSYDNLTLTSEDIKDIPPELQKELSITDSDQQEFFIFEMMKNAGGAMSLDQILVGYYKAKGEIVTRAKMNQRMYRMVQKEMVYPMPNKKGAYSIYFEAGGTQELDLNGGDS